MALRPPWLRPDPRAYYMSLSGINDRGKIVGSWETQDTTTGYAFFFDPDTQTFTTIDVPGSNSAGSARINNAGLVAINADTGSYIYCSHKKSCPTAGVHTIEVSERTIHALPGTVRSVVCQHGCAGPWHHVSNAVGARGTGARAPRLDVERGLLVH